MPEPHSTDSQAGPGNSAFVALVATLVICVVVKLVTGLAMAPLATIAVVVFMIGFALDLRLRRSTFRR